MYLPELNNISQQRYSLSGFGGINRRETAEIGEMADAVNLSSDEYPLIMPRKRYDMGTFPKTALMWHNNGRDMALIPALKSETWTEAESQTELTALAVTLPNGIHYILYNGSLVGNIAYMPEETDEVTPFVCEIEPGKAYRMEKTGYSDNYGCMLGSVASVTDKNCIIYGEQSVELPDEIIAFINPVSANIGTSTVICDEMNGMWVLEYDKDSDTYSYNKVQQKYEVQNETVTADDPYSAGSGEATFITGGDVCHVRLHYNGTHRPTGQIYATDEEKLAEYAANADYIGYLARIGIDDAAIWFRLFGNGLYEPVDSIRTRICMKDAHAFKVGDYIEIKNVGLYYPYPYDTDGTYFKINEGESELLSYINGWHEIINVVKNDDGTGWAIEIETDMPHHNTVATFFPATSRRAQYYDGVTHVELVNEIYMADGMTIERKAPENVRFICSYQNRIWANNGSNEIMCCARGNPFVWYRYEGNALDSWAATIGGDGAFTGCIDYGYPLFFKDNRMFRVTGTRPSNFGYDEYSIKGIRNGCHDSAVIVNDVLYYQSIDGIYAYNTSTPVCVSEKVYKNWQKGKACRFRDKYYIAVTEDTENRLYCYDTASGIWHREDMGESEIRYLYPGRYLDGYEEYMTVYTDCDEENYTGYTVSSAEDYVYGKEDPVVWSFETTDLLASELENKYLKGIYINCRVYPEEENEIEISVQYDGDGEWCSLASIGSQRGESRSMWYKYPTAGKRCENLKIKAEGVGKAVIYNITLEFETGSTKK